MKKNLLLIALTALSIPAFAAIPSGWSVTPKEGTTVTEITQLTVTKQNQHALDPYVNRTVKINGEAIAITQKVSNDGGTITMTLATPVTKSGSYEIIVPKGTFDYDYNDFTWEGTPNPEISWSVTVDNGETPPPAPEVTIVANPASGETVKSLESISVVFDGAATAKAAEQTAVKPTLTSAGKPVSDITFTFAAGSAANAVSINISPAIAVSGEYTLTVPDGIFDLTSANGAKFSNSEFKLNYTVKAPPVVGEKFVVDKVRYQVTSREPLTAAVTWPEDEADYSGMTTVPTSVVYEGETFKVNEIGDLAFSEVTGIGEFTVPDGIVRIGEGAFWTSSLKSITIPASVVEINSSAFQECKQLASFTLPATVKTIGEDLLSGCAQLKEVNLPEGLKEIPGSFVQGCVLLEKVKVPSTVTKIGEFAFSECEVLSEVNIPEGCKTIDRFAFAYCIAIKKLPVPETVDSIGHGIFYQSGLTEASLPENLTVIPDGTFQCCASLKEFTIGPNVKTIEKEAFFWCFDLNKITFGEKVETIGAKAFEKDEALTQVVCLNPTPAAGAEFPQKVYQEAELIVPDGALEAYKAAPGWKEFLSIRTVGIDNTLADGNDTQITLYGNRLTISGNAEATVYTAAGQAIYKGTNGEVELPSRGLYIVSANGKAHKIVY